MKNGVSIKANVIMDRPYSSSNRNIKNMSLAPSTLVTRNSTAVNSAVTPIITVYRIPPGKPGNRNNRKNLTTPFAFRYFYLLPTAYGSMRGGNIFTGISLSIGGSPSWAPSWRWWACSFLSSILVEGCLPSWTNPPPPRPDTPHPPTRHPLYQIPPRPSAKMATAAVGTHPTGMHSCFESRNPTMDSIPSPPSWD